MQSVKKIALLFVISIANFPAASLAALAGSAPSLEEPTAAMGGAQMSPQAEPAGGGGVNSAKRTPPSLKKKKGSAPPPEPMMDQDTRALVMKSSIEQFQDFCACPYSRNSDGYECGLEAAYYKPGGSALYCYPEDVRGQLRIFYRKTH